MLPYRRALTDVRAQWLQSVQDAMPTRWVGLNRVAVMQQRRAQTPSRWESVKANSPKGERPRLGRWLAVDQQKQATIPTENPAGIAPIDLPHLAARRV
ncbi:hypothetical protein CBM2617_A30074 [Cupriavidus taiwanensis]|nr:hypothetical protein CBM2617_A30074 [Cupriavidus taiwanensis]SOZ81254.1 hypothetical protein CBM2618_A40066 [Cupriavidus taiwanensis]SOZ82329.1 hypothetical protein CBM2622_A40067 [Cupriavidus taiwanensis]SOZ90685.1 hypothetical protein CBM2621_A40066 [Cupriavidus taiwanensis]